ncbi:Uncharacterised protein [Raoultella terrigena]|uniref:Uncharacterized protein n=1 Tax=Raoultella terrigena TaxID=577 RepID=A0A7Z8ZCI9_RAOTE|nr:Uncharacterised protein [Raoultella terrigena]
MSEDDAGFITKIAVFDVQVGVADATAVHFQQRFAMLQGTQRFFRYIDLMVVSDNGSFHIFSLILVTNYVAFSVNNTH